MKTIDSKAASGAGIRPALFACRSAPYKRKYGATDEDIGRAAVKSCANAARKPPAHMRSKSISLAAATSPSDTNPFFLYGFEGSGHLKVDILQLHFGVFATTSLIMLLDLLLASS
jgi:hypothetical protein